VAPVGRSAWVVLTAVAAVVSAGCGGGRSGRATALAGSTTTSSRPQTTTTAAVAATTTTAPVVATTTTDTEDPGVLLQTHVLPSADDPAFVAHTKALWNAIVADDPSLALPFFFPRAAYVQLKALPDAAADYRNRLVAFFDLDIHAAHALLGPGAATASLVAVEVPPTGAVWVLPGEEQNKVSYYRVYGTRLVYTDNARTRSFGIFSMLSWRGQWYVIHLGPNPRPASRGFVYQPEG
jgi:hypothetical protein